MKDEEIPPERAVGTVKLAGQFARASVKAATSDSELSLVPYFLAGHSIELSLKSALIVSRTTESTLRRIGHSLEKALAMVRQSPAVSVPLSPEQEACILSISSYYAGKRFEYIVPQHYSLPPAHRCASTAKHLADVLLPTIEGTVRVLLSARAR